MYESPPLAPAALSLVLVEQPKAPTSQLNLPRTSLVIPTLNEADNLKLLLPRIPSWIHEIIIIDGLSTDGTTEVARSLLKDVRIVKQPRRGKGAALQAGFEAAEGDLIVMMDGDGSMDPDEIILFVAALMAGADFVKGSRFMQGAGTSDMTIIRRMGNLVFTYAVRMLYGSSFSDLCYGYIAFWRRHVPILKGNCDGFEIETLINLRALKHKLRIIEVASFESERVHGESKLRAIPDGWRVLKTIFRERIGRSVALQSG